MANGPADPMVEMEATDEKAMTIRQRFVMAAMQGYLSGSNRERWSPAEFAENACKVADACLMRELQTRSDKQSGGGAD